MASRVWNVLYLDYLFSTSDHQFKIYNLLLGTHTIEGEPNYVLIAKVKLTQPDVEVDITRYDDETNGI